MKPNSDYTSVTDGNMQRKIQNAVKYYTSLWEALDSISKHGNKPVKETSKAKDESK